MLKRMFQSTGKIPPITGILKQLTGIKRVHPAKIFRGTIGGELLGTGPFHRRARQIFKFERTFKPKYRKIGLEKLLSYYKNIFKKPGKTI